MRCRNCGQVERFVLLVELAVVAHRKSEQSDPCREVPDADRDLTDPDRDLTDPDRDLTDPDRDLTDPNWDLTDPDWNLSLACDACASTDVVGDPARLLTAYGR